ncbi:MAG: glycine cleavage system protein H [Bdellovibrionales bacterium]|nr:glycine cleavage system protein H [Bdellovibrionales bacterium]
MTTKKSSAVATITEFLGGKLWYSREGGEVTVGLTSATVEEIGAIQSIDFPDTAGSVEEGDVIAVIEGDHDTFEVTAPMDGTILEVNSAAEDEPHVISDDPMEEGWVIKLEPLDWEEEEEDDDDDDDSDEDLLDDEDEDLDEDEDEDDEEEDNEEDDEEEDSEDEPEDETPRRKR